MISCGATIVSGSSARSGDKEVARQSDATSRGGTLVNGDYRWQPD
ncbi:hypothetical protein NE850_34230 [Paraburkholderia sp. USG1]|nr:hypothetical protein [Paraburkholderia sp. USG1]